MSRVVENHINTRPFLINSSSVDKYMLYLIALDVYKTAPYLLDGSGKLTTLTSCDIRICDSAVTAIKYRAQFGYSTYDSFVLPTIIGHGNSQ